jgi:hypothetical protein
MTLEPIPVDLPPETADPTLPLPDPLAGPETARTRPTFARMTLLVSRSGQTWRASVHDETFSRRSVGAAETRLGAVVSALVNLEVPSC